MKMPTFAALAATLVAGAALGAFPVAAATPYGCSVVKPHPVRHHLRRTAYEHPHYAAQPDDEVTYDDAPPPVYYAPEPTYYGAPISYGGPGWYGGWRGDYGWRGGYRHWR